MKYGNFTNQIKLFLFQVTSHIGGGLHLVRGKFHLKTSFSHV